jgi:hypothetical protein
MKKLTKREKLLIYMLACALIVFFGIYFVILPSFRSYQVVNDQVAEAQFTQESMSMAIDSIPSTMQARDDANASLASLKAPFQPQLTNEGLDMLLTQLSLDYSLSPKVLAIASNGIGEVLSFVPYAVPNGGSAEIGAADTASTTETITKSLTGETSETSTENTETIETTETNEATETTDVSGTSEGAQTVIGVVDMELTGTQANFYRLLDAVAARPDMVITAFAIAPETQTASSSTTTTSVPKLNGGNITISITFEVYLMAK